MYGVETDLHSRSSPISWLAVSCLGAFTNGRAAGRRFGPNLLDVEASARRTSGLIDPNRICALFHADDPVFLAFSAGEMQRSINVVYEWSTDHGATFHFTIHKTVVFKMGDFGDMPSIMYHAALSDPVALMPARFQEVVGRDVVCRWRHGTYSS